MSSYILMPSFLSLFCFVSYCIGAEKSGSLAAQLFNKPYNTLHDKSVEAAFTTELFGAKMVQKAEKAFAGKDAKMFDANIGDNLCQVRAHAIASFFNNDDYHNTNKIPSLQEDLKQYQEKLIEIMSQAHVTIQSKNVSQISVLKASLKNGLTSFLTEKKVSLISLTMPQQLITLAYLLARYHSDDRTQAQSKEQDLINHLHVTKNAAKVIINAARTNLNEKTHQYITQLAQQQNMSLYTAQKEMLKPFVSPSTYLGMRVLLADIEAHKMPVLLKTTIICPEHGAYSCNIPKQGCDQDSQQCKAAFIIEGISGRYDGSVTVGLETLRNNVAQQGASSDTHEHTACTCNTVKTCLKHRSLADIVLPNAAMHYQFVKKDASINFDLFGDQAQKEKDMFHAYKKTAIDEGLCKENSKTFCITHIYPDVLT